MQNFRVRAISVALCALSVSACATVNFAPPQISADQKKKNADGTSEEPAHPRSDVDTVEEAITFVSTRKGDYDKAADEIANGAQAFDIPLIAAGITGLNAAVFGNREKEAKRAAVFATGVFGLRSYYDLETRHAALLSASNALACVRRTATTVRAVDASKDLWSEAYTWSGTSEGASTDVGKQIARLAPIALNADGTIMAAVDDIDTLARKRLATASAPDLASFTTMYQQQLISLQSQTQQNQEAVNASKGARQAASNVALAADVTVQSAAKYAPLIDNKLLNDALVALDATLTTCRGQIS